MSAAHTPHNMLHNTPTLLAPVTAVALLFLLLPPRAAATCASPSPSAAGAASASPTPPPKWYVGRYFFHSNDAPIARVLGAQPPFVALTNTIIDALHSIEHAIRVEQQFRLNAHSAAHHDLQLRTPHICNLQDAQWALSARDQIQLRGYAQQPAVSCVTDYIAPSDRRETQLHHYVYTMARIIKRNAERIARAAHTNFSNADAIFDWPYSTKTEDCTINVLGAYRIDHRWLLNIGITNERKENYTAEFSRHYLNEGIGRNASVGTMRLPKRPPNDAPNQTHVVLNATTMMVSHSGVAAPGVFKFIPLDENLSVRRALDKADLYSQQVSDATSPSSIAILVLPLFLNLIPIALLADVSTRATFLYALLSDVLTVIPLSIKGIELMSIGSDRFIGAVVRMSSASSGQLSAAAAAEMYGALCKPKRNVLPTGVAFLTTSLVFLVAGLAFEVAAKKYASRRRRHRRAALARLSLSSASSASSAARSARAARSRASSGSADARGAHHVGMELDHYDDDDGGGPYDVPVDVEGGGEHGRHEL